MNLVIIDRANKQYHPYPTFTENSEMFICKNIIEINSKNNTSLIVQTNIDLTILNEEGLKINQGLFDKLVLDYNKNLEEGEEPLKLWKRGL